MPKTNTSDKVADGGGARAPNGESTSSAQKSGERGVKLSQENNSPPKGTSSERGQKPSSTEDKSQTKGLMEEQRDGNVVEDWDITGLKIGETIVGLPGEEPFIFQFGMYK